MWPIWGVSLFKGFRGLARSGQCRPKFPESFGNNPVPDPHAPLLLGHQSGLEQDLEMVTHRGLRAADRFDKITSADLATLGGTDQGEKPKSGRIGQCRKCRRKGLRRRFVQGNLDHGTATDRRRRRFHACLLRHPNLSGFPSRTGFRDEQHVDDSDKTLTSVDVLAIVATAGISRATSIPAPGPSTSSGLPPVTFVLPLLLRRCLAEFIGTAFLLAIVIGSGIMATNLTDNVALQLLCNTTATAAGLVALILALGPVSGAHFNPVVTIADRVFGGMKTREVLPYFAAQVSGAIVGVVIANLMFSLPAIETSTKIRTGGGIWLGEIVATLGLLLVIFGVVRSGRSTAAPFAVAGYIAAAYFFTSSTSFANPAVTIARSLSDTFAGIAPESVLGFIAMQLVGMALAIGVIWALFPTIGEVADEILLRHPDPIEGTSR